MTIEKIDKARTEMIKKSKAVNREARMKEALALIKNNAYLAQKIYKTRCRVGTPEYFMFTDEDSLLMFHCLDAYTEQLASRALLAVKQLTESNDAPASTP